MFESGTHAPLATLAHAPSERVGLLADGDGDEEELASIAATLEREGFATSLLDDGDEHRELAAIVLSLGDSADGAVGAVERLRERFAETPVVLACASIERWELRAALTAGVVGVIVGDELDSGLAACVRAVSAGHLCVPRGHWREVEPPVLSVRERQVLGLVAMGYMNRQIADRLFLAESTVKSHLSSAFGKLGVRSRSEAAEMILNRERGLDIDLPGPEAEALPAVALPTGAP
jgi:DNA-binding NarL/FixJ family response regulator